jgi:hypothetical protein
MVIEGAETTVLDSESLIFKSTDVFASIGSIDPVERHRRPSLMLGSKHGMAWMGGAILGLSDSDAHVRAALELMPDFGVPAFRLFGNDGKPRAVVSMYPEGQGNIALLDPDRDRVWSAP